MFWWCSVSFGYEPVSLVRFGATGVERDGNTGSMALGMKVIDCGKVV
jgi:hypothetical protein